MRSLSLSVIALLLVTLAGCGGGGSGSTAPGTSGTVRGQVRTANAASFQLILDGHPLTAAPAADGAFSLPNLPPGSHALAVVGPGGMNGAHASFTVVSGQTIDLGDLTPEAGGQIVGLVSQIDDQGHLTPLSGVTVLADPNLIWYTDTGTVGASQAVTKDADTVPLMAVTDANGSYVIPAVPAGSYSVTVSVPGLEQGVQYAYVSPGQTAACDFRLQAAVQPGVGTVTGMVLGQLPIGAAPPPEVSTTAPLMGATVSIVTSTPWQPIGPVLPLPIAQPLLNSPGVPSGATCIMPPIYRFQQFNTLTDRNGHYTLNVPSGHLTLTVWAEGYDAQTEAFTLQADETQTRDYTLSICVPVPVADSPTTRPQATKAK